VFRHNGCIYEVTNLRGYDLGREGKWHAVSLSIQIATGVERILSYPVVAGSKQNVTVEFDRALETHCQAWRGVGLCWLWPHTNLLPVGCCLVGTEC
jgi:hypothetical protein